MKRIQLIIILYVALLFSCSREVSEEVTGVYEMPAEALHELESGEDLDVLLQEIGDAQVVLLGEASHGTSEFYTWRDRISRRLIEEKGFRVIAVEGDWADAYPLNNYIKGHDRYANAEQALKEFDRWPSWMWANEEVADLARWLRTNNTGKSNAEQVSFYGLDVYGIWESLEKVNDYLTQTNPAASQQMQAVLQCFAPYNQDEDAYIQATYTSSGNCSDELAALLTTVKSKVTAETIRDEALFNAYQNLMVTVNAEHYYRTAARSSSASWNIRDEHMMETINRIEQHHGAGTKIIVWEHNTHVGDARATDMASGGMVNVGQLAREHYGQGNVYIVGFGTYSGTVVAARSWEAPLQVMEVPPAKRNSWEWVLHRQEPLNKIVILKGLRQHDDFMRRIGHRAIGVVYDPANESGNYVPSIIPDRYDAFLFIDQTKALQPLVQ